MDKTINTEILVANSKCPRKAFLLLCTKERGHPHEYAEILNQQRQRNQHKYLDVFQKSHSDVNQFCQNTFKDGNNYLINVNLEFNGLTSDCAILTRVMTHSTLGPYSYEPTIIVGTHTIKEEQKLELYFVAHVLSQIQDKNPISGRIVGLDEKSYTVKLENFHNVLFPFLIPLQEWVTASAPESPYIILNKHCPVCQFKSLCRAQAEQDDNLSLLDCISTPKAINKYKKKGLFTVNQLSYIFRPRKRKKRTMSPPPVIHRPELQALAIREKKIYLQEIPQLVRQPVELVLDIEGIPDQQFYYLIGLMVCEDSTTTYHPFWFDSPYDEAQKWNQFLSKARQYPDAPIYHYGSFEPHALAKLTSHYNTDADDLINRLVNINKYIFGKIYFPVYSNHLKEVGAFIGATWTSPSASGLQSLVWRYRWEESRSEGYKDLLLTYNEEDCRALKLLTEDISRIMHSADVLCEVDFANQPKRHTTEVGEKIHREFVTVLKIAHMDYDKKKISLRSSGSDQKIEKKKRGGQIGGQAFQRILPKADKIVQVPQSDNCPKHKEQPLKILTKIAEQTIIDLDFNKRGIKKTVTKYVGVKGYCSICSHAHNPPALKELGRGQIFGHGFQAWTIYQRLVLRLPYNMIVKVMEDQFHEIINESLIMYFINAFAQYYAGTERILIQRILESPFVHVDETKINIQGFEYYVWVFTDGKHTVFKMTKTREITIVHNILGNYNGVLVSDFYPGYDSMQCRQQKCLSHLIRDLNEDLWKESFNIEFGAFVLEVKNLIVEILKAVEIHGLNTKYLNKFCKHVDLFYFKNIDNITYNSEVTIKYQKRFMRYRHSIFTFLAYDFIPWNNNTAERAIRHLAVQRKISGTFHETAIDNYLLLLGIAQSCRFQNKSLLGFLLSKIIDIDQFKGTKTRKHTRPVGKHQCHTVENKC
jgi:predicted RecB family nuclease